MIYNCNYQFIYCYLIINDKRYIKVGHCTNLKNRIKDIKKYNNGKNKVEKPILLCKIRTHDSNIKEKKFHQFHKKRRNGITIYTDNFCESISHECYHSNDEMYKILHIFFIDLVENDISIKTSDIHNYTIGNKDDLYDIIEKRSKKAKSKKLDEISISDKSDEVFISDESKIYTKPILDCPLQVPKDIKKGSKCAIYTENGEWEEGIISEIETRNKFQPNITITYPDLYISNILATKDNYGIDKCWCLI